MKRKKKQNSDFGQTSIVRNYEIQERKRNKNTSLNQESQFLLLLFVRAKSDKSGQTLNEKMECDNNNEMKECSKPGKLQN